jgi:hypothetical protein
MSYPDLRMHFVLERAIRQFERINEADKLTGADKQQLKNAYLQNYFEPETRELLKAKLANEARSASRNAGRRPWRRSKTAS